MDATIKTKWLEALRSGKYVQGTKALRRKTIPGEAYCCLGVLCDIVKPDAWTEKGFYVPDDYFVHNHASSITISLEVRAEASITIKQCEKLAMMNDSGKSFEEIADYIEASL